MWIIQMTYPDPESQKSRTDDIFFLSRKEASKEFLREIKSWILGDKEVSILLGYESDKDENIHTVAAFKKARTN